MEASTVGNQSPELVDNSGATTAFYVYITISTLGMIGNAFVCLVMVRNRKIFNSTTNKLILHQSFVDFLASFVFILRRFLVMSSPVPGNAIGSLYCKLWWSEWPQFGMFVTSTYNLVAISMERYFATCHSVSHRNMFKTHRLKVIITVTWLCAWVPEIHLIPVSYQTDDTCVMSWPSRVVQAIVVVMIFLWELVIPLAIMIFAYTRIILELHKRSKARVGDNTTNDAQNMLSKANKNVTKTLFVVAVFFAICWAPTDVNYLLYNLGLNNNSLDSAFYQATGAIVLVNMCLNPLIYCLTYDRFQKQAWKMICGRCKRQSNQVDMASNVSNDTCLTQS